MELLLGLVIAILVYIASHNSRRIDELEEQIEELQASVGIQKSSKQTDE